MKLACCLLPYANYIFKKEELIRKLLIPQKSKKESKNSSKKKSREREKEDNGNKCNLPIKIKAKN